MKVLLVTKDSGRFSALEGRLRRQQDILVASAANGGAGLTQLANEKTDVVIVDEHLGDMGGIDFVKRLVKVNPLANTAIVSTLSDEEFHEATEGLGVLMQLPAQPQEKNAEALLAVLEKIGALMQPVTPHSLKAGRQ